jgi:plasmid stabilization system protein ParE
VRVAFLSPALREILEAIEYYEGQAIGLGGTLDADLQHTLDFIVESPSLGSPYERGTRRVLLRRFPYLVVYRTLVDRILVVAFAHAKRRPGYWADRV